ncbi:GNAT family N-acetyltransferase [Salmonirosea aquatica]|uniref:GNAT family N-acetyltransferase n=1 Tax=Salmonirosea aquatica TaxID=2654236 RepID=A0A7C9FP27_9BACT|nr:GNAT family N-acetyltransferase [Cytophagaceae bacterium SJW1-29]
MIRPYHEQYQAELIELLKLNVPRYFAPAEVEDFKEYLSHHVESYFVMEQGKMIVGCGGINYIPQEGIARLSWDIIHPDHQGKGIGTELTRYRIGEIKKHSGIRTIIVRTTQLVYPFYEKLGFPLDKTETDFWAPGFDLYQMKMELAEVL